MAGFAVPAVLLTAGDGSSVRIDRFPAVLGRSHPQAATQPDCDLSPLDPDQTVSRRHLELSVAGGELVVVDLGARNGTWLNGTRLEPHVPTVAGSGGELILGQVAVTALLADGVAANAPAQTPPSTLDATVVAAPAPTLHAPAEPSLTDGPMQVQNIAMPVPEAVDAVAPPFALLDLFLDPAIAELVAHPGRVPMVRRGAQWERAQRAPVTAEEWVPLVDAWVEARSETTAMPADTALLDAGLCVELVLPPLAAEPALLAERVPPPLTLDGMVNAGLADPDAAATLRTALAARDGVIIVGASPRANAVLLGSIIDSLPGPQRVAIVERRPSVRYTSAHAVRLRYRGDDPSAAAVIGLSIDPECLIVDDATPAAAARAVMLLQGRACSCVMTARAADSAQWFRSAVDALATMTGDAGAAERRLHEVFAVIVSMVDRGPLTARHILHV